MQTAGARIFKEIAMFANIDNKECYPTECRVKALSTVPESLNALLKHLLHV